MPTFDTPLHTNDQSIDRVLAAGLPVLLVVVEGQLVPALDAALRTIAKDEAGALLVATLDARDNPQTAAQIPGARPALAVFQSGDMVSAKSNLTPDDLAAYAAYAVGRGPQPVDAAPARPMQAPARPLTVTDASFRQEVLASDVPVLVDLWAEWCGPCHMIAPIVERIAQDYAGRLKVVKLNVDENPLTPRQYQVQGIPTLLIVSRGRVVDRLVGAMPEPVLRGRVDAALRRG